MLGSSLVFVWWMIGLALGSPIPQGSASVASRGYSDKDVDVLNFALTAELLEANYYSWGLDHFSQEDFDKAGFKKEARGLVGEIRDHEVAHAELLTAVLKQFGAPFVKAGEYKYPVNNVEEFVAFAGVLEQIGASAYSGAASILTSSAFVERAATILSIEARQSAYLRHIHHPSPFPATYETPLTPSQVFSLASALIVSQPADNPNFLVALGIEVLPSLTVSVTETPTKIGDKIKVDYKGYNHDDKVFAIFLSEGFSYTSTIKDGYASIPEGVAAGQIYVFVSKVDSYTKDDGKAITGVAVLDIAEKPFHV